MPLRSSLYQDSGTGGVDLMPQNGMEEKCVNSLPEQFRDLQRLVEQGWSVAAERERNAKRLSSSMAEIQALYDSMLPKMDDIITYLNKFPLDHMPEDARRLFYLTLSLAEVAPAVEFYKQPDVVDGFPASRFIPIDVPHMTPKE
jgi:hypothetical protein